LRIDRVVYRNPKTMTFNHLSRSLAKFDLLPLIGRNLNLAAALCVCMLLAACTGGSKPQVSGSVSSSPSSSTYKVGKPYKIAGNWYTPREDPYYDKVGIASWYGKKFNGRPTANGETYDMNDFSAAHKTLPMPSFVKVTNLNNNRSLVVRINDRGPFVHGRIIDLSRRAAKQLGFLKLGTTRVRVEAVKNPIGERFVIAKGTTSIEERKSVIAVPAVAVESSPLAPPTGLSAAPAKAIQTSALETSTLSSSRARGAPPPTPVPTGPSQLYVQAGAFSELGNAHRLRDQLDAIGSVAVAPVQVGETQYYRVRIGPMDTIEGADQTLTQLINNGHPDARIVVDTSASACQVC